MMSRQGNFLGNMGALNAKPESLLNQVSLESSRGAETIAHTIAQAWSVSLNPNGATYAASNGRRVPARWSSCPTTEKLLTEGFLHCI